MKIIARTKDGYILEADAADLAACDGYDTWNHPDCTDGKFPINTVFRPRDAFKYLKRIRILEAEIIAGVDAAAALAAHLGKRLPTFIATPTPDETTR